MSFSEFYEALLTYPSMKSVFNIYDVLINFLLPAALMVPVTIIYTRTHKGVTYNQSFTHTLFTMTVTTSIIMMVIGSNIARAFSLVGALSIVRFRTAIKDSKDTGYIFASIAIGMAAGTGMYLVAVCFSVLFCVLMLALNASNMGKKSYVDKLLKVQLSAGDNTVEDKLENALKKHVDSFSLVHSEQIDDNNLYTFIISTNNQNKDKQLLETLKGDKIATKSSIFYNDQRIEI